MWKNENAKYKNKTDTQKPTNQSPNENGWSDQSINRRITMWTGMRRTLVENPAPECQANLVQKSELTTRIHQEFPAISYFCDNLPKIGNTGSRIDGCGEAECGTEDTARSCAKPVDEKTMMKSFFWKKLMSVVLSRDARNGPTRKSSPWDNFSDGGLNQSIKRRLSL